MRKEGKRKRSLEGSRTSLEVARKMHDKKSPMEVSTGRIEVLGDLSNLWREKKMIWTVKYKLVRKRLYGRTGSGCELPRGE